ncbi:hypothetical protein M5K25_004759 [Dendrobium thyrsiflorum]|uniref:Uncharacterized protein n=1 Tax=Dendrobium thyrsiflorum TaxID=117978 RepID=A0ABD0VFY6_DENTH
MILDAGSVVRVGIMVEIVDFGHHKVLERVQVLIPGHTTAGLQLHVGDSAKRRRSRSRSPLRDDQLNERSPRNHVDSFPVKSEYSRSPQNVQNRSPRDHEYSFAVKSECSRLPQNVQNRSPSACSAMVSEDSPSQKIGSSNSPQNDLIDLHTDGYQSSKECERSFSPLSGSGRSPDVQKGFESDVPAVSEPDLSGLSEHMNRCNSPSPST